MPKSEAVIYSERHWFSGTVIFFIFVTVFFVLITVWGVCGRVTERVDGKGVTLLSRGVSNIVASADGIITSINIAPGSDIKAHQVIGQIYNPEAYSKGISDENDSNSMSFYDKYWIRAPFDGHVIEIFNTVGSYVHSGEKIALTASSPNDGIYVLALIKSSDARKIQNGMRAYFSPLDAPPSIYGYVKAVVREVSGSPINTEVVTNEIFNKSLSEELTEGKSVVRIVLELIPDIDSPSGYKWTGGEIYKEPIVNGTVGNVIINVDYRTPASYVFTATEQFFDKFK